jgi:hypothetical protein
MADARGGDDDDDDDDEEDDDYVPSGGESGDDDMSKWVVDEPEGDGGDLEAKRK